MEITYKSFLQMVAKRWWIAVLTVILCFSLSYVYASFLGTKKYSAEVVMKFGYGATTSASDESTVISSCTPAMKHNVYLEKLATELISKYGETGTELDRLDNEYANDTTRLNSFVSELANMLKITTDKVTYTVSVVVTTVSPKDAYLIANEIVSVNMRRELCILVGKAESNYNCFQALHVPRKINYKQVSPNILIFSVIGVLLGLIIGAILIIVFSQLDVRVKDEDDLLSKYNLPVLGVIPSFPDIEEVN